jgi:methylmalonyl-CoA mutase
MPPNSIHSSLIESFAKINNNSWKRAASQEIEGKDPFQTLSWKTDDDIIFFPYYDSENLRDLSYLKKFSLTVAADSYFGARKWLCVPPVHVTDEKKANAAALEHLQQGADGIFFYLAEKTDVATHDLLQKIEWTYCSLFFYGKENLSEIIAQHIQKNSLAPDTITGTLFWDRSPKKSEVAFFLNAAKNFKCLGLSIPESSPVEEVANALTKGVQLIEDLKKEGETVHNIINSISFSVSMGAGFFESIAKLKALRLLWYQVALAYEVKNYSPGALLIHARSEAWIESKYQPHANMLKGTTAAMASVLGGCDALTVYPEDDHHSTMHRIARNVSSILREESHLDKVVDPLAGSYALDTMVHAVSAKAWTIFQSRVK